MAFPSPEDLMKNLATAMANASEATENNTQSNKRQT